MSDRVPAERNVTNKLTLHRGLVLDHPVVISDVTDLCGDLPWRGVKRLKFNHSVFISNYINKRVKHWQLVFQESFTTSNTALKVKNELHTCEVILKHHTFAYCIYKRKSRNNNNNITNRQPLPTVTHKQQTKREQTNEETKTKGSKNLCRPRWTYMC